MNKPTIAHAFQKITFWGAIFLVSFSLYGVASAEESADIRVSTNGMTATASFVRPTPCTAYELEWGDGEENIVEAIDEICIQVIEEKTLRHTYEEEGEYTITLTQSGETWSETVTVPGDELSFGLDDVSSITAKWVDPYELMADEEYYIYTITLKSGEKVTVEAGGFTTVEYRNEQFINAGYTGDVDALLALVESDSDDVPADPEPKPTDDTTALYEKLINVLRTLIEHMERLLSMRGQ